MLFTGSGRHRKQSQAEKAAERAITAAGVVGVGIALPLLAATSAQAAPSAVWDRVADCESGGNWSLDSGDGMYGGLQITAQRWVDYGGTQYAELPSGATRSQQIAVAERILATEGPQPWASCADSSDLRVASAPGVVDTNDSADESGALRGARGAAAANTASDGTVAAPNAAPVFSGLPGYDPVSHVYWYQKNGGWFWTSHQSLYERYMQLTHPQPPTAAPSPTTTPDAQVPTAPATPVGPAAPTDPSTTPSPDPTPSPTTPSNGQNGNGSGHGNGNGAENGNSNNGAGNGQGQGQDQGQGEPAGGSGTGGNQSPAPTTSPTAPNSDPSQPAGTLQPSTSTPPTSSPSATDTPAAGTPAAQPYTVGPGDTLAKIARTHELDGGWTELYNANKQVLGENPDLIQPGQVLNLG
ncbi:LysM peptidoglycan-binding domain-containing protein [Kitasatospora griseola]|uniref:LysM peptidoglycan-binding domain-containing protein n=1 Tax=Kitasatospora griseola TaxID=2064 RepID=UPI0005C69337|nr:transglycosylase family protein [Kitasatospora griseola]